MFDQLLGEIQPYQILKIEDTAQVIYQYTSFTVKLCGTNDDRNTSRLMLKKMGQPGKGVGS